MFLTRLAPQLLKLLNNIIWDVGVREAFLLGRYTIYWVKQKKKKEIMATV